MTALTLDLDTLTLAKGGHGSQTPPDCGNPVVCFWEARNVQLGRGITDSCPPGTSLTLHGFLMGLNDALHDDRRQRLIPYLDRTDGTADQPGADKRAAYLCVDWLIRCYTPAFLTLAGLHSHASALASAPEVTDMTTLGGVTDHISAARSAAYSAARSAAYSAAYSAADSAARSAADSAAYSAARSAARSAADSAARSAADSALAPTVEALQESAFDLLDRMLDCYVR